MKNKSLLITLGGVFSLGLSADTHAQSLSEQLTRLHIPTEGLELLRDPFTSGSAAKPTGNGQKLIAAHLTTYLNGQFVNYGDSVRYYWHQGEGEDFDPLKTFLYPYTLNNMQMPPDPDSGILVQDSSYQFFVGQTPQYTEMNAKILATLDQDGYITEEVRLMYDATTETWTHNNTTTYGYDAAHHLTSKVLEHPVIGSSVPSARYLYSYEGDKEIMSLQQFWNSSLNDWNNFARDTSVYDSEGNWISFMKQEWFNGDWQNTDWYTFDYNTAHQRTLERIYRWEYVDTSLDWVEIGRTHHFYNTSGQRIQDSLSSWTYTEWIPASRASYEYDAQGRNTVATYLHSDGSYWYNHLRYQYEYNGNLLEHSVRQNGFENGWQNTERYNYGYNSAGNLTQLYSEMWDNNNWYIPVATVGRLFFYEDVTGIHDLPKSLSFGLYPNPATTQFTIDAGSKRIEGVTITDISGKTIFQNKARINAAILTLPVSQLPAGVYYIKIQCSNESGVQQLVIRR